MCNIFPLQKVKTEHKIKPRKEKETGGLGIIGPSGVMNHNQVKW